MEGTQAVEEPQVVGWHQKTGFLRLENGLYFGEYDKMGSPHGSGILLFDTGDIYIGWFKKNSFHGPGLLLFSNGACACGTFKYGLFNGQCVLKLGNGDLLVGWFQEGKRDGYCLHHSNQENIKALRLYRKGQLESVIITGSGDITEDGIHHINLDLYEHFSLESFDLEPICENSSVLLYESKCTSMYVGASNLDLSETGLKTLVSAFWKATPANTDFSEEEGLMVMVSDLVSKERLKAILRKDCYTE